MGSPSRQEHGEENVFDLSLGNPVMEPPPEFLEELRRIAENPEPGMHRYMPNAGYPETRAAVAAQLSSETGLDFAGDHVVMTCGAGGALNVVLKTLLDPGDEVVIFAPYFVEYMFYADNHGGRCSVAPPDSGFLPDFDAFESSLNDRTRVVLVNSPNNPTGVVYQAEILARLGEAIRKKEVQTGREIFLVSDEPYRKILFDGLEYPDIFPHHTRSIVATSHSKDLALPGERIGIIAVNPGYEDAAEVVDGLTFSNRTLGFVNAPALMQHIVRRPSVGNCRCPEIPGPARLPSPKPGRHRLLGDQAPGRLLHVPPLPDRRRRGVRRRAEEAPGPGGARKRLRSPRPLPNILLRRRQDSRRLDSGLPRRVRPADLVLSPTLMTTNTILVPRGLTTRSCHSEPRLGAKNLARHLRSSVDLRTTC